MRVAADIVAAISQRLAAQAGLELPAWVVEARAAARIEALGVDGPQYLRLIERSTELDELIEAVRVGETRLFRHRAQIATLRNELCPALRCPHVAVG